MIILSILLYVLCMYQSFEPSCDSSHQHIHVMKYSPTGPYPLFPYTTRKGLLWWQIHMQYCTCTHSSRLIDISLGNIAIRIYWIDAFILFLVSQTCTRITLAVNRPHPICPVISYLLWYNRVYVHSNYTTTRFSISCNLLCLYDWSISL